MFMKDYREPLRSGERVSTNMGAPRDMDALDMKR